MREIRFSWGWKPININPYFTYAYVDITISEWDIATDVYEIVYKFQRFTSDDTDK